jgi:hypothetical protein
VRELNYSRHVFPPRWGVECEPEDSFMRRMTVVVLLSALVSGCFASDQPLFSAETAVLALGDGGRYATFELDDGKEKPSDPLTVRPGPGNVYEFVNEKGAATPVTFHPLAGDEHVAQVKLEGDAGYGYVLVRLASPKETVVVPVECNKQDAARMQALGVVRRDQFECRIDKVGDAAAFFLGLKRSEPTSRMVRE